MFNSIEVTETTRRAAVVKGKKNVAAELAALDWHTLSVEETCGRLGVAPEIGLDKVRIFPSSSCPLLPYTGNFHFAELGLIARHFPFAGHGRPSSREGASAGASLHL